MNEDIEIYAKALTLDAIRLWLEASFEEVEQLTSGKAVHDFLVKASGREIPVMIVENAVGKAWTSIWFKSPHTPLERRHGLRQKPECPLPVSGQG